MPTVRFPVKLDRTQLALAGRGFISETYSLHGCTGQFAAPGGTAASSGLQGTIIGLRAGDVISNLVRFCGAAGASVTLSKMGLFKTDGTLLAATADNHASLSANTFQTYAIAKDGVGGTITSYTVTADGAYYIACLDLASGGTAPTFFRASAQTGIGTQFGSNPRACFNVNSQSDISGNVTPGDASAAWWFAVS